MMGSSESEARRDKDESPQHEVSLTKPFAVGRVEVTRGQFARFVADTQRDMSGCYALNADRTKWELQADKH